MRNPSYMQRREQLTTYFDQTAAATWQALTSNEPVSRIRRTVRAGRDAMRDTLLGWLPTDMTGHSLLDAGCGTGALAIEAARRGADVIAVDVAPNLIRVARQRAAAVPLRGSIEFRVGDMLGEAPAEVDHIVAMDSLIHYDAADVRGVVAELSQSARRSVLFTSAPWTAALAMMHFVGRLIPQSEHRAPAIAPIRIPSLIDELDATLCSDGWGVFDTCRVNSGFYISQAIGLQRR